MFRCSWPVIEWTNLCKGSSYLWKKCCGCQMSFRILFFWLGLDVLLLAAACLIAIGERSCAAGIGAWVWLQDTSRSFDCSLQPQQTERRRRKFGICRLYTVVTLTLSAMPATYV